MIRVKLLPGGRLPERMSDGAAGWDCFANGPGVVASGARGLIALGFCVELPEGWEMQVRGRSSLALRDLCTHVGTIDSDYRGEVRYLFWNLGREPFRYEQGKAVCQVVFQQLPRAEIVQVDELSATKRGEKGFGSTDKPLYDSQELRRAAKVLGYKTFDAPGGVMFGHSSVGYSGYAGFGPDGKFVDARIATCLKCGTNLTKGTCTCGTTAERSRMIDRPAPTRSDRCPRCDGFYDNPSDSPWRCICP